MINDMTPEELKTVLASVPETEADQDEIEAIERANKSIAECGTITHDFVNWD